MKTEIKLHFNSEEIRDIYFRTGNHKYIFGHATMQQSTFLLIGIILLPFLAVYSLQAKDFKYLVIGGLFFALLFYNFWKAARPIIYWKKSVHIFLEKLQNFKEIKLVYTDKYITQSFDKEEETTLEWLSIDHAVINEELIWLYGSSNILIPKSSMKQSEFEQLSKFVKTKVKKIEME